MNCESRPKAAHALRRANATKGIRQAQALHTTGASRNCRWPQR